MAGHSKLSPSSAPRWMVCPGSVAACEAYPESSSVYADEGTRAHDHASKALRGVPLDKQVYDVGDEDMAEMVKPYVEAVKAAAEGKLLLVEERVSIEQWTGEEGGGGTADAIIIDVPNGALEVHDLKYGKGVLVDAQGNAQLRIYGLGAVKVAEWFAELTGDKFELKTIRLVIHQPRRDHVSEETLTAEELKDFGDDVIVAARATRAASAPRVPSEKGCRWCDAKGECEALRDRVYQITAQDFAVLDVPTPVKPTSGVPTEAELSLLGDWINAVKEWIYKKLMASVDVPGWKLVLGKKGNTTFAEKDETKLLEQLQAIGLSKKKVYAEPELMSPTALLKAVPKKYHAAIGALTKQADGKPTAVSVDNEKPAFHPQSVDDFPVLDAPATKPADFGFGIETKGEVQ